MTTRYPAFPFLRVVPIVLMMGLAGGPAWAQESQPALPDATQDLVPESGTEAVPALPEPDAATIASWQEAVTGQVVAFREGDPGVAFSYAGEAFHAGFPSAEAFFVAIIGSGYAPIMLSRSHSFGEYQQLDADTVAQVVRFVGQDQLIHEAIYLLGREEAGWRVHGVQLKQAAGVGI